MACRVALPSPAERFRGRAAFCTRRASLTWDGEPGGRRRSSASEGASPPRADQGDRQRHAVPRRGMTHAAFPSLRAFFVFCSVAEGRVAWARAGKTPGAEVQSVQERIRPARESKIPVQSASCRSAAARERCGSLLRMRQAGFRRLRGKRPGARRQSSSSLSGRSISSRTAAAGSAFS